MPASGMALGFLIVPQEDVRAGIEGLTSRRKRNAAVGGLRGESLIGNLSEAIAEMADSRTGALVVLHGREPIDRHIQGGVLINGRVSVPLLLSLFNPQSPAHDGAVILLGDPIKRFAAHLPLSADGLPEGLTVVATRPQRIRVGMERQPDSETPSSADQAD